VYIRRELIESPRPIAERFENFELQRRLNRAGFRVTSREAHQFREIHAASHRARIRRSINLIYRMKSSVT
jgi:hypothetical protein